MMLVQQQSMPMQQQAPAKLPLDHTVAFDGIAAGTVTPFKINIVYQAKLHENAKYLRCCIGGGLLALGECCYYEDVLRKRSHVQITENSIIANYPMLCACCPLDACVQDMTTLLYLDKYNKNFARATMCTPYHYCCFIEFSGQVVRAIPGYCPSFCNNVCCTCFICCTLDFFPALQDAEGFANAANKAVSALSNKTRYTEPGALMPVRQDMM